MTFVRRRAIADARARDARRARAWAMGDGRRRESRRREANAKRTRHLTTPTIGDGGLVTCQPAETEMDRVLVCFPPAGATASCFNGDFTRAVDARCFAVGQTMPWRRSRSGGRKSKVESSSILRETWRVASSNMGASRKVTRFICTDIAPERGSRLNALERSASASRACTCRPPERRVWRTGATIPTSRRLDCQSWMTTTHFGQRSSGATE